MRFNTAQVLAFTGAEPQRVDRLMQAAIDGASADQGADSSIASYFRGQYARMLIQRGDVGAARQALFAADVDPDLKALSRENRDRLRDQIKTLFGQPSCDGAAFAPDADASMIRASRIYCELVFEPPEPG
jgi:hypothetical protein